MNQFPVGKNRWNSLYTLCIHFALEERPVHHLMADARIQQGKDVECLHHIGAVGTSERYVGLQTNIALKGTDAASDSFIGQVLSLAIGIEYGQQKRGELMSVGDATEGDTRIFTVLQEGKGQGIAMSFVCLHTQTR